MAVDTAAVQIAIRRARGALPDDRIDPLHHLDHALRSVTTDLLKAVGESRNSKQAMAIGNLLKDHIEALTDLQTLARCRASAFISKASDPFGDDV